MLYRGGFGGVQESASRRGFAGVGLFEFEFESRSLCEGGRRTRNSTKHRPPSAQAGSTESLQRTVLPQAGEATMPPKKRTKRAVAVAVAEAAVNGGGGGGG